jgi:hypothetical protein
MNVESCRLLPRIVASACACAAIGTLLAPPMARGDSSATAADVSPLRWSAAVELPPVEQATLAAFFLDSAIFAATRPDLADVRLRNRQGEPVALVLRRVLATKQRTVVKTWPAVERGAKPLPPSGLEIFIDPPRDQEGPLDGISVGTPLHNFEQQVRVYASSDGQDWQPVSPPTVIFDYARFVDVRSVNVPITRSSERHFRLVIDDVTAEEAAQLQELSRHFQGTKEVDRSDRTIIDRRPFRVDRISFYRNQLETETTGVQTARYPATDFRTVQDAEHKQTLLQFNSAREPLSTVRLLTDETNFSRAASLEIAEAGSNEGARVRWRTVATATLLRFSLGTLKKDELSIAFPEQHNDRYRIVIENGDSPPVAFSGVEVEGPEYQGVFLAEPGQSLTLEYGWPNATAPRYDTAAIDASLAAGNLPARAELAAPVENTAAAKSPGWSLSALLADKWVVTCLVAGLCIALGWGLYRAARRIDVPPAA